MTSKTATAFVHAKLVRRLGGRGPPDVLVQGQLVSKRGVRTLNVVKENLLVKSLHPKAYEKNPNFLGMAKNLGFKFKAHKSFTKADIDERQALLQRICEVIWNGQGKHVDR